MKKPPELLTQRSFWMANATALILCAAVGIVFGSWSTDAKEKGAAIGGVVSAFLGAAIAVTGAAWIQARREALTRKQVLLTVSKMIPTIRATASDLSDFHTVEKMSDRVISQALASLKARRDQIIRLGPLHGVLDGDLPISILDTELAIETFELQTETKSERYFHEMGSGITKTEVISKSFVRFKAIALLRTCDRCLELLNLPVPDMTSSQRSEMRRIFGDKQ